MKQINATRDEIIEMLKKGEIVFASKNVSDFERGAGIRLLGEVTPCWSFVNRESTDGLGDYGEAVTAWFVEYSEKEKFEFQVGDVCSFGGIIGAIVEINYPTVLPISWRSGAHSVGFTKDGRVFPWTTEPLLKFISRPSKKVKKTVKLKRYTVAGFDNNIFQTTWSSGEGFGVDGSKIIKTETKTIEYETEE